MNRTYFFTIFLLAFNWLGAQNQCRDCLKVEVLENEYFQAYPRIPNSYIVDERKDTFDFNLLDVKLTFRGTDLNYMVYPAAFETGYYRRDSTPMDLNPLWNLDSFAQNIPFAMVLIENRQGDIKLLGMSVEKGHPSMNYENELDVSFYKTFRMVHDSLFSMQIRILNNSLRIRENDTMVRFHYLYTPSVDHLRDYFTRRMHLDMFERYADSGHCGDCSNTHLVSNWFELAVQEEIRIVKKKEIDDRLNFPRKMGWPSPDSLQGNALYDLLLQKIAYPEDGLPTLPIRLTGYADFNIVQRDSMGRPKLLLVTEPGLLLHIDYRLSEDSFTGRIFSVILDLEGRYTAKTYAGQLPLALNYSDTLDEIRRKYPMVKEEDDGKYIQLYPDPTYFGTHLAKITCDRSSQRIVRMEIFRGDPETFGYR